MSVATHPYYVVRRALADEQNAICALVRSERLNPHHLHFENFAVAVRGGEVIGASQIRRHQMARANWALSSSLAPGAAAAFRPTSSARS